MSGEWEFGNLEARVRRLEAWQRRVTGADKPPVAPEPSRVEKALAACAAVRVSETVLEAVAAQYRGDDEAWAGALEELAEEGDLRARARRGGIDLEEDHE